MTHQLDGRAFARLRQFASLDDALQADTKACEAYLTEKKDEVFGIHHYALVKTVRSIRGKPLLETIDAWLKTKDALDEVVAEPASMSIEQAAAVDNDTLSAPPPPVVEATVAEQETAVVTPVAVTESVDDVKARRERGKQLIEALVLRGFITPNKENDKSPKELYRDNELYVPVAKAIADENATTTVWDVVEGAIFAGMMKRKAGFLAPLTHGKDVYVVVNETLKTVFLFDSDVARVPIAHFEGPNGTFVSFDTTHFVHGIKIWNEQTMELVNTSTKLEQDALVHALITIGAQYREVQTLDVDAIQSIYALKDVDMDGNEVSMDKYKGKVLLIVNVSSLCGFTPINYPELVTLDEKYRTQGLEILAFPCNQFGGQEPGSHEEIVEFGKQYNCQFALFEKRDVNGAQARPVFTYLKTKLPGAFGNYIKWNFTKFLVDRNGQPVRRFAPNETPLSFEQDIVALLEAEPEVEKSDVGAVAEEPPTTTTVDKTKNEEATAVAPMADAVGKLTVEEDKKQEPQQAEPQHGEEQPSMATSKVQELQCDPGQAVSSGEAVP